MKPLLTEILSDDAGNPSSLRLALLMALAIVLVVWAVVSLQCKALLPLPGDIVNLLGLLIAGKTVQKFTEAKAGEPQP